jgi:hypothetical protein
MRLPVLTAAAVILTLLLPRSGWSQERWPVSVELGMGVGTGSTSGIYKANEDGVSVDALVAVRLRDVRQGGLVAAGGIGLQGAGPFYGDCPRKPDGSCLETFPQFAVASAMLGWETSSTAFRLLAGPAYVVSGDGALALQARADAFLPLLGRLGIGLSGRVAVIPDYDGDAYRIFSGQVGLRVR